MEGGREKKRNAKGREVKVRERMGMVRGKEGERESGVVWLFKK